MTRTRSHNRCEKCLLGRLICICPLIPRLDLDTRVVVVMHWREKHLTTNTARLATLALPNSEIRIRGRRDQPMSTEGMQCTDRTSLLLYPSEKSVELGPGLLARLGDKPITLVVPDGSWRQAHKVGLREPIARNMIWVKAPAGPPSEYQLRREPDLESLSTFEAIARALGAIEGSEVQHKLETIFRVMVGRTLWSRGKISSRDCPGGVPAEAIVAAKISGFQGDRKPVSL